jgi:hypothetical protein
MLSVLTAIADLLVEWLAATYALKGGEQSMPFGGAERGVLSQFAGMGVPEIRRLKQLEEENRRLEQLVADLTLDKTMLQDVVRRKW